MIHVTVIVLLVGAALLVALPSISMNPHPLLHAGAKLQKLAGDMKFTEGPVWIAQRRRLPCLQRHPRRRAEALVDEAAASTFPQAQPPGQRQHARPRGPAHHVRARAPGASRARKRTARSTVLVDSLRGQEVQLAQRRGGEVRRHDLVHRPAVRAADRRSAEELEKNYVFRFEPRDEAITPSSPTTSTCPTACASRPTSERFTCRQRQAAPHPGVRRDKRRKSCPTAASSARSTPAPRRHPLRRATATSGPAPATAFTSSRPTGS